jgi:hypothetical protein
MSHDHGTMYKSAHTVSYDRHTTNTVQVRIIHGRYGIVRVYTVSLGLVRYVFHGLYICMSCTTKTTTTCCHPQLEYPTDHSNLLTLMNLGTQQCLLISLIMISNSLILSSVASGIVLYNQYSYNSYIYIGVLRWKFENLWSQVTRMGQFI